MLQRTRRVHRLILEIQIDTNRRRHWKHVQMGVSAPVRVGVDPTNRLGKPFPSFVAAMVDIIAWLVDCVAPSFHHCCRD